MPEAPVFTRLPGISNFSISPGVLHAPKPPALPAALHPDIFGFCRRRTGGDFSTVRSVPAAGKGTHICRACRTMLLYRSAAGMSSSRFFARGYPGVSGNGPPFVDAGVLSAGHPGVSGDDRSGTGKAGSRPGHPGVMVYSAAAAHIDEGEHP